MRWGDVLALSSVARGAFSFWRQSTSWLQQGKIYISPFSATGNWTAVPKQRFKLFKEQLTCQSLTEKLLFTESTSRNHFLLVMSKGFLTIAYGNEKYIRMGKALAHSVRLNSPTAKLAAVTDRTSDEFSSLFDLVIPVNIEYPPGVAQKLFVDLYSPFEETIYIDSDCLVYKDIDDLWSLYRDIGCGFGMVGNRYLSKTDGHYYAISDLGTFFKQAKVDRIGLFNSGVFYFNKSYQALQVFESARQIYNARTELCIASHKNSPANDEPIFALAMEKNEVAIIKPKVLIMATLSGELKGQRKINVLSGRAKYIKNNWINDPYLIHFHVSCSDFFIYWREVKRLETNPLFKKLFYPDIYGFIYSLWRRRFFYWRRLKSKVVFLGILVGVKIN